LFCLKENFSLQLERDAKIIIGNDGNVGIGITASAQKLNIKGCVKRRSGFCIGTIGGVISREEGL